MATKEFFNIFDSETHEWIKGLTRQQLADFVLGKYKVPFYHCYQPGVHKIQHVIDNGRETYIQGFVPNIGNQFSGVRIDSGDVNEAVKVINDLDVSANIKILADAGVDHIDLKEPVGDKPLFTRHEIKKMILAVTEQLNKAADDYEHGKTVDASALAKASLSIKTACRVMGGNWADNELQSFPTRK